MGAEILKAEGIQANMSHLLASLLLFYSSGHNLQNIKENFTNTSCYLKKKKSPERMWTQDVDDVRKLVTDLADHGHSSLKSFVA